MGKNEFEHLFHTTENQLKVDHRPKQNSQNYQTFRMKHRSKSL